MPEMTMRQRVLRNSAVNLAGQGTFALLQLVAIVVLSRALGAAAFGRYYTIFACVLVVQLVSEGGLTTILTARLARQPHHRSQTIAEGATLFAGVAAISWVAMMLLGTLAAWGWQDGSLLWSFVAAGAACAAIQVQRFCSGVLQAHERFGYENAARVTQGALFAAGALILVTPGVTSVTAVVVMLAASHAGAALLLACGLWRARCAPRLTRQCDWRGWLTEAGPLGAGDVIRSLTWQLDTVLLGALQPARIVGIYSVAYRPLGPLNYVPRAVLSAQFPELTRLADEPAALQRAVMHSARLLTMISIPIAVAIFIFAEPLVLFIGGAEYLEAATPLRILIWITVLSFVSMHFRYVLVALGKQRTYAWLVAAVLAVEFVIEVALIPSWGYLGACAGSLTGEVLFVGAGVLICRREFRGATARVLQPGAPCVTA